jgi:hypothetical protein
MGSCHELVLGGRLVNYLPAVASCIRTRRCVWLLCVSALSVLIFKLLISDRGLNMLAFIMIFFFVPETKQRTLEELDYIFAVPLRTFISYQATKTLPWWLRRHALRQKDIKLEPLYRFDNSLHDLGSGVRGARVQED